MCIIRLNIGGSMFTAMKTTLQREPTSALGQIVEQYAHWIKGKSKRPLAFPTPFHSWCHASRDELFLDVNPKAFEHILNWLRSGRFGHVSPTDRSLLTQTATQLGLLQSINPLLSPNHQHPTQLVVQCTDHIQHEQGVKKHAVTITFGHDGFSLNKLCARVRHDLSDQLSTSFWQMYQTGERSAFFVTTRVSNGTADLMTTSLVQRVIEHNASMGYRLMSSYVALSPDALHTSVRTLVHHLVFEQQSLFTDDPRHQTEKDGEEDVNRESQLHIGPMVEEENVYEQLPSTMRIHKFGTQKRGGSIK